MLVVVISGVVLGIAHSFSIPIAASLGIQSC